MTINHPYTTSPYFLLTSAPWKPPNLLKFSCIVPATLSPARHVLSSVLCARSRSSSGPRTMCPRRRLWLNNFSKLLYVASECRRGGASGQDLAGIRINHHKLLHLVRFPGTTDQSFTAVRVRRLDVNYLACKRSALILR